jgi:hypothetical protein
MHYGEGSLYDLEVALWLLKSRMHVCSFLQGLVLEDVASHRSGRRIGTFHACSPKALSILAESNDPPRHACVHLTMPPMLLHESKSSAPDIHYEAVVSWSA